MDDSICKKFEVVRQEIAKIEDEYPQVFVIGVGENWPQSKKMPSEVENRYLELKAYLVELNNQVEKELYK
ncbi:MAG: hypothetical protein GXY34_07425 [Syntrophomonadaceae bacterium]|nr:hypothetical protein [Syntrophomonadaceae bacterium]